MQKKRAILQRLSRNSTKNTWITFTNLIELFWIRYVSDFPGKGTKLPEIFPRQFSASTSDEVMNQSAAGLIRRWQLPARIHIFLSCTAHALSAFLITICTGFQHLMLIKTSCLFHHICSGVLLCLKKLIKSTSVSNKSNQANKLIQCQHCTSDKFSSSLY